MDEFNINPQNNQNSAPDTPAEQVQQTAQQVQQTAQQTQQSAPAYQQQFYQQPQQQFTAPQEPTQQPLVFKDTIKNFSQFGKRDIKVLGF